MSSDKTMKTEVADEDNADKARIAELEKQLADQSSSIDKLMSTVESLTNAVQSIPAAPAASSDSLQQKTAEMEREDRILYHQRKLTAKLDALAGHTREKIEQLESGEHKFHVSMDDEPRMDRIVGAQNAPDAGGTHEAVAKFQAYFGIISTNKRITATEIQPENYDAARESLADLIKPALA